MTTAYVHQENLSGTGLDTRPHPSSMTPQERAAELLSFREWPKGMPFLCIDERIQLLIGRRFRRGEGIKLGPKLEGFNDWVAALECVPAVTNDVGWEALAEEARQAYPKDGSEEEVVG